MPVSLSMGHLILMQGGGFRIITNTNSVLQNIQTFVKNLK